MSRVPQVDRATLDAHAARLAEADPVAASPERVDSRCARSELAGLSDDDYFWELMAPAWDDRAGGTAGQRVLAVATYLVRDVENGGLHQALWNRTDEALAEVLGALERLGATEQAVAVRTAAHRLLGEAPPAELDARRAILDAHPRAWVVEQIEPLDRQLYDERRLWPLFRRLVDAHPGEFFRD